MGILGHNDMSTVECKEITWLPVSIPKPVTGTWAGETVTGLTVAKAYLASVSWRKSLVKGTSYKQRRVCWSFRVVKTFLVLLELKNCNLHGLFEKWSLPKKNKLSMLNMAA